MIGIVVIGRNEEKSLYESLKSALKTKCLVVYADSASIDNSLKIAQNLNIETVELSQNLPMNAARGRNAGAKKLLEINPHIEFIQFLDGDTILEPSWISNATTLLNNYSKAAIVSGVLLEKNQSLSIYKELSALEWQRDPGFILCCGGNMMIRKSVFLELKGFDPNIIGGEDTELCYRTRQLGWDIIHSDSLMAIHDAKMSNLKDVWNRFIRTGYGYQQISSMYVNHPEKLFLKENISNWIYGGIIPITALLLAYPTCGWSLFFFVVYPILIGRIYLKLKSKWNSRLAFAYAISCTLGKFPGFYGACKYFFLIRK